MYISQDKGKDEAYDESRQTERRLKDKRGLGRTTRFDDPHTASISYMYK